MHSKSTALHLHVESVPAERITSPFRPLQIEPPCSVPAGIPALDEPTGGLPRGCLTEIYGPPSSGKTSLLNPPWRRARRIPKCAPWPTRKTLFDPAFAQSAGVSLRQPLRIRCNNLDHALRSVDLLLHSGGFGFGMWR